MKLDFRAFTTRTLDSAIKESDDLEFELLLSVLAAAHCEMQTVITKGRKKRLVNMPVLLGSQAGKKWCVTQVTRFLGGSSGWRRSSSKLYATKSILSSVKKNSNLKAFAVQSTFMVKLGLQLHCGSSLEVATLNSLVPDPHTISKVYKQTDVGQTFVLWKVPQRKMLGKS